MTWVFRGVPENLSSKMPAPATAEAGIDPNKPGQVTDSKRQSKWPERPIPTPGKRSPGPEYYANLHSKAAPLGLGS